MLVARPFHLSFLFNYNDDSDKTHDLAIPRGQVKSGSFKIPPRLLYFQVIIYANLINRITRREEYISRCQEP